jgi:hypothetical protein
MEHARCPCLGWLPVPRRGDLTTLAWKNVYLAYVKTVVMPAPNEAFASRSMPSR